MKTVMMGADVITICQDKCRDPNEIIDNDTRYAEWGRHALSFRFHGRKATLRVVNIHTGISR